MRADLAFGPTQDWPLAPTVGLASRKDNESEVRQGVEALKKLIVIVILGIAMLTAAPAFAGGGSVLSGHSSQPPASQVMKTKPTQTAGQVEGATATPTKKSPGTLPFTGLDLSLAAFASVALVGAGIVLRRAGRSAR